MKAYKFNPIKELDLEIPRSHRREAMEAAANYIREAMLDYIGEGKSPVSGGKWVRSLTKEYAKLKSEESSAGFANLELSGDLLDSLIVESTTNSITIDVPSDQEGKAEGHLTGVYGDHSKSIRPRQFMPQPGETFKRDILQGLKEILSEFES
jgi:hypothetical protein